jgi:hypothetical protein
MHTKPNGNTKVDNSSYILENPEILQSKEKAAQLTAKPNGLATGIEAKTDMDGSTFDPERWKIPTDTRLDPNVKIQSAAFSKIEVRKPPKDHFVHAHPNPAFNGIFPLYADSEAKRYEPYLIAPELSLPPQVRVNVVATRLAVAVTDSGHLFLWYVPQTGSEWHESADSAILLAMTEWVKVIPDGNGYRRESPQVTLPPPDFPAWNLGEYLARAFKTRYIESVDHDVIKRLAGIR